MCEFVKTENGWKVCWGGAALHGTRAESAPRPVIRVAETAARLPSADPQPAKGLSASTPSGRASVFRRLEQRDADREAVNEVRAADRADLALGEEAGQRDRPHLTAQRPGVVVRGGDQPAAAPVAAEQQTRRRPPVVRRHL